MIFSIDLYYKIYIVYTKCNSFILKCFIQFACTNLDGSKEEVGNFLNLLKKEGVPSEKGGSNPGGDCD